MKKYVSVLMVLLAAFMFFTCDDGGGGNGDDPVIPKTLTLEAGSYYTFTSTADFTLSISGEDIYIVEPVEGEAKKIFVVGASGTATVKALDADKKELAICVVTVTPISMTVDLNKATWPQSLITENKQSLTPSNPDEAWPAALATSSYANNVLTLTYNGKNRQMGVIPLTAAQDAILSSDFSKLKKAVTFRIEVDVTLGNVPTGQEYFTAADNAGFRLHIGDPSVTKGGTTAGNAIWWNATSGSGIEQGPFPHVVEYRTFDHAFDVQDPELMPEGVNTWSNFKYLVIQAMFINSSGSNSNSQAVTFPEVKLNIKSVKIDIGDTRTPAEIPAEE